MSSVHDVTNVLTSECPGFVIRKSSRTAQVMDKWIGEVCC